MHVIEGVEIELLTLENVFDDDAMLVEDGKKGVTATRLLVYFHVVTSCPLPLPPFSSMRVTPLFLRKFRMRSASAKLDSFLALFRDSISFIIYFSFNLFF